MRIIQLVLVLLCATNGIAQELKPLTTVPIETDFNLIHVPVQVGDQEVLMILDTGAAFTVIDEGVALKAGLEIKDQRVVPQPGGEVRLGRLDMLTLGLGSVNAEIPNVRTVDLSSLKRFIGKETLGIIGYDFIKMHTIEVDYLGNAMHIFDKDSYTYQGDGTILTTEIIETKPLVSGDILHGEKEFEGKWLLDTGSLMSVGLSKAFAQKDGIGNMVKMKNSISVGFGGSTPGKAFKVDGFKLGDFQFENIITGYAEDEVLAAMVDNGVIGGEILSRFTLVIDYERLRFILEPNPKLDGPIRWDLSGMMMAFPDDKFMELEVLHVFDDAPAMHTGIKQGDMINAIDGMGIQEFTYPKLWKLFHYSLGRPVTLTITRENKQMDLTLVLAEYFD
ncbi:aspartyl protease family protein [Muricauda sp. 2012CJ35-5]|uniref:Aspartyl protease family protein n=1 Tax=Flagellimonas spongiicola TaxID=2942208 RepID=A0ABT0PM99_9FLAO|nr:aspartyl protease family protein [Allomuricauda spongiicola]MCL6272493.1 aspartyl protease family protein [Allomuricauda spongiicola]